MENYVDGREKETPKKLHEIILKYMQLQKAVIQIKLANSNNLDSILKEYWKCNCKELYACMINMVILVFQLSIVDVMRLSIIYSTKIFHKDLC